MSSEKSEMVKCPYCDESFSRRGLQGHLRFKHQKDIEGNNIKGLSKPLAGNIDVLDISKKVRDVCMEIEEVEATFGDDGFFGLFSSHDSEKDILIRALNTKKKEFIEQLNELVPVNADDDEEDFLKEL